MSPRFTVAACFTWLVQPVRLPHSRFVPVLLAVLLVSLGWLLAPGSAHAAPPAPVTDLRAQVSGTSVILRWTHSDASVDHYEVWWSDSPYATPGDAGMVMIATVTPGASSSDATYTDTASGVGNTAVNSFYAVRGVTAGGELSALSNRAGEFDFGLPVAGPLPIVDHCGAISADQNWGPNALHQVTCNVTVASGVKLTVLPGTVVKFLPSTGLFAQGTLNAAGTKTNPIVFASIKQDAYGGDSNNDGSASAPAAGDWYGIFFDGAGASASLLNHVVIEYAGQQLSNWHGANWTNALVFWQAAGVLQNSRVSYAAGSGVYVTTSTYPTVASNTFQGNGRCAVDTPVDVIPNITHSQFLGPDANDGICGRGTTILADGLWQNQTVPYLLSGSIVVTGGVTVTIQAGTQLHFLQNSSLTSNGTLESSQADVRVAANPVFMDGVFTFRKVDVVNGGLLTHSNATTDHESQLVIQADSLTLDATSMIDVSGRGYLGGYSGGNNLGGYSGGNNSAYGRTIGNTTTGGSQLWSGGSYGGWGGQPTDGYPVASVYGALTDPNQLGAGGGGLNSGSIAVGGNGGGLIRITANTLTLDGAIRANGSNAGSIGYIYYAGGGAGGGIRLDVGTLTGAGAIQAIGGNGLNASYDGGGGGGRIAIYYTDMSGFNSSNITAYGGTSYRNGGAGTVFLKSTSQSHGDLVLDNNG
ncbi:MAG: hypothetical protein NT169_08255, partial [Chloroflexi bacterium]|nr:hypothetical protein [Chloroflexota bacterium]